MKRTATRLCSRRSVLAGAAWLLAARPLRALAAAAVPRVACVDWAMLETAMALGVTPVAATELLQFRRSAVEPVIPERVADLGLRGAPNLELLYLQRPELILSSPFYASQQAALEAIAPVLSLPFYLPGEPPFAKALAAVEQVAARLGVPDQGRTVLAEADARLEGYRQRLARFADRPFHLINIGDARHFRAFGADSMFGDVLQRLGLENAWTDQSRFSFAAPVPLEMLAARSQARIVIVSEVPVEARGGFEGSMIWKMLEPVREDRVIRLANINPYGGITAGLRFARLLTQALEAGGEPA
ncbi:iron-siderophore ABC transporter substrate-binding protein [Pannonibacter sp. I15F10I1]|uniref:iron-siderophore ABC transporter substrate-binding protein n=1 Tax=Pannonibacter sp. I15F10I1 TaxID=2003580 RepID=UPI0016483A5C|nr:iron-siderophore ABC transporter substrate-binding protein [Pannonibacter sp. I15F10I1]